MDRPRVEHMTWFGPLRPTNGLPGDAWWDGEGRRWVLGATPEQDERVY